MMLTKPWVIILVIVAAYLLVGTLDYQAAQVLP